MKVRMNSERHQRGSATEGRVGAQPLRHGPRRFFKSTVFKQPLASRDEKPSGDDLDSPRFTPSMRIKNKINKLFS